MSRDRKMLHDTIPPTPERLSKNTFDRPEVNNQRNARAYIARDQLWELLRNQDIGHPEYQAGEKFRRHCIGLLNHDVRTSDTTEEVVDEHGMPGFQLHGLILQKTKEVLTNKQIKALELLLMYDVPVFQIGLEISRYKTREQSKPYALAIIQTGLDRLSILWGLKTT